MKSLETIISLFSTLTRCLNMGKQSENRASWKFAGTATVARGCWIDYFLTSRESLLPLRKKNKLQFTPGGGEKVNIPCKGRPCVFKQVSMLCVGAEKRKTRPN